MKVKDAHQALSRFSGKNAGIGISLELIRRLIDSQIGRLNSSFSKMDANQGFHSIRVSFSGQFDTTKTSIRFEDYANPNDRNQFFPTIVISNLGIKILGFLDGKQVVEILVEYQSIIGIIEVITKALKISLFNEEHQENSFVKLWDGDLALRDYFQKEYGFTDDTWNELTVHFKATTIFSSGDIAESFIDALDMPDIFQIFNGIKFGQGEKIGADRTGELLMFTADSSLNFGNCAVYNPSGQTQVKSIVKSNGKEYEVGELQDKGNPFTVETEVDSTSPTMRYPVGENDRGGAERIETGDLFLFTPIDLLRVNFDAVKPAMNASDSGRYGPIRWRYSITAAIKSFSLHLIRPWPTEFRLRLPSIVVGQAGAGVKIGCIRYEAGGAMFDGQVDPLDINFRLILDWPRKQIVFISKIESIKGKDFYFRSFPRARFPVSEIIDFILAEASKYLITQQADKILSVTRIPIANLHMLEKVASLMPNSLAGETDAEGNVTMGVVFRK